MKVRLFQRIGESALVQILVSMEPMEFHGPVFDGSVAAKGRQIPEQGEVIIAEDSPSANLYVIIAGYCFSSAKDIDGGKPSVLGPGDCFGERSALSLGFGEDGKQATRTVWARGAHHGKLHKGPDGKDLPWPVLGTNRPAIDDMSVESTVWTQEDVRTAQWTTRDKSLSDEVTVTHIRMLPRESLALIFAEFPDAEAKMREKVKQKKRVEDEALRKKYIVNEFFPTEQHIRDTFDRAVNHPGRPRDRKPDMLTPEEVVQMLKPHRRSLISDTLSDYDFAEFVKGEFDEDGNQEIDLKELTKNIVELREKALHQLLEVHGLRRKSGVMTAQERRSMTTDAKVDALDAKVDAMERKMDTVLQLCEEMKKTMYGGITLN
jgi:CRP-like cAMP-binding protein